MRTAGRLSHLNAMADGDNPAQPWGRLPGALAATTLLAAGFLVSTLDFAELLLVAGAVFLPTRDFFSTVVPPGLFNRFTQYL